MQENEAMHARIDMMNSYKLFKD